jgi:uncharacterized alpha-E superfamily protein
VALLSRNADRIFWAARYLERAEDTSRLVQEFGELFDDMPINDPDENAFRWAPLLAVCGDRTLLAKEASERDVVDVLVCDPETDGSVAHCVAAARANLRTTREVLPREAWHTVNDLSMFVATDVARARDRRFRSHILERVANDSRRLDGILTSSMNRDAAWEMWRMGRYLERADMTTRVVGVRAAVLMAQAAKPGEPGDALRYDEVQWMGVLRSLSALQMYQRSTHGAIEASSVVRFLLFDASFPRSVRFCLDEIDRSLDQLTRPDSVRVAVSEARDALMSTMATTTDGADLDQAMDWVQSLIGKVNGAITDRYLSIGAA